LRLDRRKNSFNVQKKPTTHVSKLLEFAKKIAVDLVAIRV